MYRIELPCAPRDHSILSNAGYMIRNSLAIVLLGGAIACTDSTAPGGPTSRVTLNLCSTFGTGWFAYQNEGSDWTALTPNRARQVSFDATRTVSVAMSRTLNGSSVTRVVNATSVELQTALAADCVVDNGPRFITGLITGVTGMEFVRLAGGPATDFANLADPAWRLDGLTPIPVDLIAARYALNTSPLANRILVRRAISPADAAVADLNFENGAESAPPQTETVTFTGVGNATVFLSTSVRTASGTAIQLGELSATGGSAFDYVSLPSQLRRATDLHFLSAVATTGDGTRYVAHSYAAPATKAFAFGPMVGEPTLSSVSGAPYVRPRAQFASQPEYSAAAQIDFSEGTSGDASRSVSVLTTAGFLGGVPLSWEITFPDFRASGFPAAAGLRSTSYVFSVLAYGGAVSSFIGGASVDGETTVIAVRTGQAAAGPTPGSPFRVTPRLP